MKTMTFEKHPVLWIAARSFGAAVVVQVMLYAPSWSIGLFDLAVLTALVMVVGRIFEDEAHASS